MTPLKRQTKPFSIFDTRPFIWTVVCIMTLSTVALVSFSETAHAGLLSFMASVFSSEQAAASVAEKSGRNSQNLALLAAAVNPDPNPNKPIEVVPVYGGETLVADMAASNATDTDRGSAEISIYTVRNGDTLSEIARMFNVSVNTIAWANDISRSQPLKAGQTLIILPVSGVNYTVKKGDTVKGIVAKYKGDLGEVLRFNDLSLSSSLSAGEIIIIPNGELSAAEQPAITSGPRGRRTVGNEPLLEGLNWPALPGYFIRPIIGGIKTQGLHGHNGIDLGAPVGTPIRAAAAGTVIIARAGGWNGGYGNFVAISHPNGTQTLYAHTLRNVVSAGEAVSQGQIIGYIGMTGLTTGPHVHFEIRGAANPF
ncbi:MAG: hypothetical protein QOG91_384 [Candidatus Parcubacteria bacterium]|jgi:murein DD-endopeptidase MepM/ murein hydrolase activator NlpD|nr:hypothetical protein [Candidatus Parcubacteria bacterium]